MSHVATPFLINYLTLSREGQITVPHLKMALMVLPGPIKVVQECHLRTLRRLAAMPTLIR
jgi:hypothetical protein